jgi:hypothetical protein
MRYAVANTTTIKREEHRHPFLSPLRIFSKIKYESYKYGFEPPRRGERQGREKNGEMLN